MFARRVGRQCTAEAAHALQVANQLKLRNEFEDIVRKELRLTKKRVGELRKEGPGLLEQAGRAKATEGGDDDD